MCHGSSEAPPTDGDQREPGPARVRRNDMNRWHRRATPLASAVLLLLLGGCGDDRRPPESPPQAAPVTTAVDALGCAGPVFEKGAGDYEDGGLEQVQDTPEAAWADLVEENDPGVVPHRMDAVDVTQERALLVLQDQEGRVVAAAVAANGTKDGQGGTGWGIEQWAVCDPSELPARVTADFWLQVWEGPDGDRVLTSRVSSYDGPAHCDWQDVRFLQMAGRLYLRDPHGKLADVTRGTFGSDVSLPDDARDTGFQRDGVRLWSVPSRQEIYAVQGGTVERWPSASRVGCA